MTPNKYITLIIKKLGNEISEEETKALNLWLNEDDAHQEIYSSYEKDWKKASQYKANFTLNKKSAWQKIEKKLSKEKETKVVAIQKSYNWYKIVATITLLIAATFFVNNFFQESTFVIAKTTSNENKTIALPDGSTIYLNENSSIKYAKNFEKRNILLEGEAFFEVAKDAEHPFIVSTGKTSTQVLGTTFNIDANKKEIEVALITGKVKFSNDKNNSVILNPGETALYDKNSAIISMKKVENQNDIAWKTKKLVFDNTNLYSVKKDLEEYFGIQLKMATKNNCVFTGTFENAHVEDVLEILSFSLNSKYSVSKGIYSIDNINCTQ